MSLRDSLLGFVTADLVPDKLVVYILLVPASLCGGITFAHTGSWLSAIFMMGLAFVILWYVIQPIAEWIGLRIVNALLFILP